MTSSTTKEKKRRDRVKYPNINPNVNLPSRVDYLEGFRYIDGVVDETGKMVIRPLNDSEKAFLDKFEAETVSANFLHTPELKAINRQIRELKKKLDDKLVGKEFAVLGKLLKVYQKARKTEKNVEAVKIVKKWLKKHSKWTEKDKYLLRKLIIRLKKYKALEKLQKALTKQQRKDCLHKTSKKQRQCYNDNNTRNFDLYGKAKVTRELISLDIDEYDRFTTESLSSIDPEYLLIHAIEDTTEPDSEE